MVSGGVPPSANLAAHLPASDHMPMSYQLAEASDGTPLSVLVYNVCWEIFKPTEAADESKFQPSGRILVPLAEQCTANVLAAIEREAAAHDLILLQEVPTPIQGNAEAPADSPEKLESWQRFLALFAKLGVEPSWVYLDRLSGDDGPRIQAELLASSARGAPHLGWSRAGRV